MRIAKSAAKSGQAIARGVEDNSGDLPLRYGRCLCVKGGGDSAYPVVPERDSAETPFLRETGNVLARGTTSDDCSVREVTDA